MMINVCSAWQENEYACTSANGGAKVDHGSGGDNPLTGRVRVTVINEAWRMRHKLMQVMMERDREHPLSGCIELDDAYLGGRTKWGQARSWRARQDALCRRRPDQRAGTPVAHEAHCRRGLPSHRNRRLGAAAPRHGHSGRLRWVGLLSWRHRSRLRS